MSSGGPAEHTDTPLCPLTWEALPSEGLLEHSVRRCQSPISSTGDLSPVDGLLGGCGGCGDTDGPRFASTSQTPLALSISRSVIGPIRTGSWVQASFPELDSSGGHDGKAPAGRSPDPEGRPKRSLHTSQEARSDSDAGSRGHVPVDVRSWDVCSFCFSCRGFEQQSGSPGPSGPSGSPRPPRSKGSDWGRGPSRRQGCAGRDGRPGLPRIAGIHRGPRRLRLSGFSWSTRCDGSPGSARPPRTDWSPGCDRSPRRVGRPRRDGRKWSSGIYRRERRSGYDGLAGWPWVTGSHRRARNYRHKRRAGHHRCQRSTGHNWSRRCEGVYRF
jgi:hypothetical protein